VNGAAPDGGPKDVGLDQKIGLDGSPDKSPGPAADAGGLAGFVFDPGYRGTGRFSDGESVTVVSTAGGFGIKPKAAKALYYWPLDGDTKPHPLLSRTTTNPDVFNGKLQTTTVPPRSGGAVRWNLAGSSDVGIPGVPFTSDVLYVWIKRRYDFSFSTLPEFNLKPFRLWYMTRAPDFLIGMQAKERADGNPRYTVEMGEGMQSFYGGFGHEPAAWLTEEYQYRASGLGVRDGVLYHIRDARHAWDSVTWRLTFRDATYPGKFDILYLDQRSNASGLAQANVDVDAIYVDDSWCRVVVSDTHLR
jgi:hypothetical protein